MSVRVTSILSSKWLIKETHKLDAAVAEMATEIHANAGILAPFDKGNLAASGVVRRRKAGDYVIQFGGSGNGFSIPYAKRRHYENNKNPQTLLYLERAGDGVARKGLRHYLRSN